ncbi:MAG TPA: diguanylate cyclase [Albitalea sp.]|nr:diguanylate cyclase [Albitalea sp.]
MNNSPDRSASPAAKVAPELAQLQQQIEEARALLGRLQRDVAEAENNLNSIQTAQLLEANEQLVLAVLRAQIDAETAAHALDDMSRSSELDTLTELPNRTLLLDRFAQASANARRHGTRMALLFLDLDNFKQVNDTLGHAIGDEVLKLVALRLASAVREADTVSRHGGDEFVVLLTEVSQASDALAIADKMIAALGAPSRVGDQVLHLTASIGVSIYPDDGEDANALINRADAAMYRAKRQGPGSVAVHGEGTATETVLKPALESRRPAATDLEPAPAEHKHSHVQLREAREANTQLVLAALGAQELQSAAERAHERLTKLMAVAAHELRSPLQPIRTAAALLGRVQSEELPRLRAIIERQVERVISLVGDLLDVSRASTGKLRLECQVVDMAGVIAEAVDACQPSMTARAQHFGIDVPSCPLEVNGDPVRLVQIVSNLLDNASKYTPEGGEIGLSVAVANGDVVITVTDSGIGSSAEALPHIFEPFAQETHAIGFNGVGLGLGLAVVRELAEAHGGQVGVRSAGIGLGSQFVVTLPLAERGASRRDS